MLLRVQPRAARATREAEPDGDGEREPEGGGEREPDGGGEREPDGGGERESVTTTGLL